MKKFLVTASALSALILGAAAPAHAVITTFATMSAVTTDNLYFKNAASNGKSSTASLYSITTPTSTVPGSVLVKFSFINETAALTSAVTGVNALLTFNATTTSAASELTGPGYDILVQPGLAGTFSLVSTTAITVGNHTYASGSNLLSATFSGAGLSGPKGSTSGGLDANNQQAGSTIVYTSDFVTFEPTASLDAALSLTAIQAPLSKVAGSYALKTFKTDAGGSFSADPVPLANGVPEPASWAMMLVGVGAVGGIARRRKALVAA